MAHLRSLLLGTCVIILLIFLLSAGDSLTAPMTENPRLLLVASTVKDGDILAAAANEQTIVVQYDTRTTTLESLLDSAHSALNGRKAASIAIAAHDYGEAKFYLTGSHTVDIGSLLLSEDLQVFWRELGELVESKGSIDILACGLASGEEGLALIAELARLSGVQVAASSDKTGNPAAGGNWLLETADRDVASCYFAPDRLELFTGLLVSETQKLTFPKTEHTGYYGGSLAISGDYLFVSARNDRNDDSVATGSLYIYRLTSGGIWTEFQKIIPSDGMDVDLFGTSVAISGDVLVVGAPGDHLSIPDAYIYRRQASGLWTEVDKIAPSVTVPDDFFAYNNAAIDGDSIVIGAYGIGNPDSKGVAYVFRETAHNDWTQVAILTAPDVETRDYFGWSVDIEGDLIAVGSYLDDEIFGDAGSVFVFRETALDTWDLVARLNASDAMQDDHFGSSVKISGDLIVVGADYDDYFGSAYIFRETATNSWSEVARLNAPVRLFEQYFGRAVDISGDRIIVGAYGENGEAGSAYLYQQVAPDVWEYQAKLMASDYEGHARFGYSVAVSGDHIVCGAFKDNNDRGAVYYFRGSSIVADGGSLRVTLNGANGGGWKLEGQVAWRPSGDIQEGIPEGVYTVVFKPVSGYETPSPQTVTVIRDSLVDIEATYEKANVGSVVVNDPDGDAPSGAGWRPVEYGSSPAASVWYDFGETIEGIEAGELTIEFRPAIGHITPATQTITVKINKLTSVSASYLRPFIAAAADYDGDGRCDPAVYDPRTRIWSVVSVNSAGPAAKSTKIVEKRFGTKTSIPAPGDYDGNGVTDLSYYDPATGTWRVLKQLNLKNFGEENDIPVPGDYLGLGYDQPALFRPGEGLWLIYDGKKAVSVYFGSSYDIPVPADYDGDGITDFGTYDVREGSWIFGKRMGESTSLRQSSPAAGQFGAPGDIPVPADYDGDGKAEMAIFKPEKCLWMVSTGEDNMYQFANFGRAGDCMVPADWDGDGDVDIAVYRARNGTWEAYNKVFKARHGKKCRPLISSAR